MQCLACHHSCATCLRYNFKLISIINIIIIIRPGIDQCETCNTGANRVAITSTGTCVCTGSLYDPGFETCTSY